MREEVAGSVKAQPGETRSSRRGRNAVPDEVIEAVERAAASERGRRSREVTVEAEDGGGRRTYVVPRGERF
jgi:hypothetical protein